MFMPGSRNCRHPLLTALILPVLASLPVANASVLAAADKEHFLQDLLSRMSLAEKAGQLQTDYVGSEANSRQSVKAVTTGQIGVMVANPYTPRARLREMQDAAVQSRLKIPLLFAADVVHGYRTIFPIGLGLASSWDMQAVAVSARVAAVEASADGRDMTFAPMLDITRDPRWGRISESPGEDSYLASRIASVTVQALQGPILGAGDSIMACIKHFAAYGAVEGGRDYNTVDMSPLKLYEDYLPPYRAAIEAGAGAVMVALTVLNGTPSAANKEMLRNTLRRDWNFQGLVISDHGAISGLMTHGTASDARAAARIALDAGTQVDLGDSLFGDQLPTLVEQGLVPMGTLDAAVRQVLSTKYDLGLFANPYRRLGLARDAPHAEKRLHRAQARDVARRSLVLLKNRNQLLPLKKQGTIALIGPLADNRIDILGSWPASGRPGQAVSLRDGLKAALGGKARLLYAEGANIADDLQVFQLLADNQVAFDPRKPAAMLAEANAIARQADVIVLALGEARGMSHESASKTDLNLPLQQRQLLQAMKQTGKPLVLVLMNGRPLTLGVEGDMADAILETWFSGTEGGNAIADVLFGDYNPSGKLPVTFPRNVGQIPLYYNHFSTGRPFDPEQPTPYKSFYFDTDNTPLYPFGFGLSYTRFELSHPTLTSQHLVPGQTLRASVQVTNTGPRSGETVVQLYLRDVSAAVSRPLKALKGFHKLMLAPGESRTVTFDIDQSMLAFYDQSQRLVTEPGWFEVMLGQDSENLLKTRFELLPARD